MSDLNFSIIIPHYNIPRLLQRCLDSIPQREDLEIIVVDDNSSPDVVDFDHFPGQDRPDVTLILDKKGGGGGYARNLGLEVARGKWLLFADSDDLFTENLPTLLDEYVDSTYDVIFFNIRRVLRDDISKPYTKNFGLSSFDIFERTGDIDFSFRVGYSQPWGKIIRRKIVADNQIKFDEIKLCNDFWFSVQTNFKAQTIYVDKREIYYYTYNDNSVSAKSEESLENIKIRLQVHLKVQRFLRQQGIKEEPLLIRGLMVELLKTNIFAFIKEICKMPSQQIPVFKLLYQIFCPKYFSYRS